MSAAKSSSAALILAAIGVVYGDIGTSVLYAVKEVFGHGHVPFTLENVYGILSMFFWTLTVIVSLKYVVLVLRADNDGEGGLVAMLALASQAVVDKPRLRQRAAGGRHLRHLALLRRRRHHAGDLGAVGGRGPGGRVAALQALRDPDHAGRAVRACSRCRSAARRGIGRFFGPITLAWFLASRCWASRRSSPTRRS